MWEIHSAVQALTFLYSAVFGIMLCACYDVLRAWRRAWASSSAVIFLQDILFWSITAVLTFLFLLARTDGEVRSYVFLGQLTGFVLFRVTLSRFITAIFAFVFKGAARLRSAAGAVYFMILTRISAFSGRFFAFCRKKYKNMRKHAKKLLKKSGRVLYTETNN